MMKVFPCFCPHVYQDSTLGKGQRYWNPSGKNVGDYTCTVCGRKQSIGGQLNRSQLRKEHGRKL